MAADVETLTHRLLDAAIAAGADAADAMAIAGDNLTIEVRGGVLEQAERSEGIEIGLRVLIGRRQACVGSSDIRDETIATMAERAVAMAREAPDDPWCGLADPAELGSPVTAGDLDLYDGSPLPTPAELEDAARAAEAAAISVAGVTRMDVAGAGWTAARYHQAMTNGFSHGDRFTSHGIHAVAIVGEGTAMERDHASDGRAHRAELDSPETIGQRAGERAVARFGGTKPPTGAFPVVYDERVAGSLLGHLVGAMNGVAVARGASWLKDSMGERVLPAGIDLVEEPHRPRVLGSRSFDAEGLATARRIMVADGVLQSWCLDLGTARQLGLTSTASAYRSVSGPPHPGVGNVTMTQGGLDRAGLLAEMGTGLLVTSLIGSSINPTTGDYSRGASGFWVEGGEIVRPVNECTIAGNLRDMLPRIRPANDARTWRGHVIPSLLVEGLVIAGA